MSEQIQILVMDLADWQDKRLVDSLKNVVRTDVAFSRYCNVRDSAVTAPRRKLYGLKPAVVVVKPGQGIVEGSSRPSDSRHQSPVRAIIGKSQPLSRTADDQFGETMIGLELCEQSPKSRVRKESQD
jgi:hypothetical protein